jgi:short-subunit dehydrogenase
MAPRAATQSSASSKARALVTGASSGIGAAFARRLARDGRGLILVARRLDRLEELATELRERHGHAVTVVAADLTQPSDVRKVEEQVASDAALDLLGNNAGCGSMGRCATLDPDREEEEVRLNVIALQRLTRAALPGMIGRKRGGIINVSSMAGLQAGPCNATYSATKAFVNSFTEALHEELRGSGVQMQALCPGFTRTEFQQQAGVNTSDLPSFAWMSAEAVVDASLAGLGRGDVVLVPGFGNRVLATVAGTAPRPLVRRLLGIAGNRITK